MAEERSEARPGQLEERLFSPENMKCPHAVWRSMRTGCPVPKITVPQTGRSAYLVTRKRDIEYVASHPEIFSGEIDSTVWRWGNDFGPDFADIFADGGYATVHTIVTSDPPRANKYRKIVLEALSPKRIAERRASLQAIVDELLGALPADGVAFDFKQAFAVPLPLLAIIDIFGLPKSDSNFVFKFTCDFLSLVDPTTPLATARENAKSLVAAQKYLVPMLERYRVEPRENFLSFIANAQSEMGELLSIEEALSIAFIALIGGNETTRNAIAIAAFELARHPDLWNALKADPAKVPAFSEEIVRYGTPATLTPRQVKQRTELSGTTLEAGAPVFVLWGSGSHDDEAFEKPEEIRLDRERGRNHTSFGFGVHHCAGIHLARTELNLSIESWLNAFESMRLAVPEAEIEYEAVWAIRSLRALPIAVVRTRTKG